MKTNLILLFVSSTICLVAGLFIMKVFLPAAVLPAGRAARYPRARPFRLFGGERRRRLLERRRRGGRKHVRDHQHGLRRRRGEHDVDVVQRRGEQRDDQQHDRDHLERRIRGRRRRRTSRLHGGSRRLPGRLWLRLRRARAGTVRLPLRAVVQGRQRVQRGRAARLLPVGVGGRDMHGRLHLLLRLTRCAPSAAVDKGVATRPRRRYPPAACWKT